MNKQELVKRYLLLAISLFFSALGVAITKHGALGVSPISSVANVMSERFSAISLGTWLMIWNGVLILGQILLLRRNFQWIQLLQIPVSLLFGYFTDFGMWCVSHVPLAMYWEKLLCVLVGVVVLGFGVSLSVIANVIMNSGEAFVKAICDSTHMQKNFGNVKIAFDVSCVVLAVLLSLIFFHGSIVGTREGTIISACFTGLVVKFFLKWLLPLLTPVLTGKKIGHRVSRMTSVSDSNAQ